MKTKLISTSIIFFLAFSTLFANGEKKYFKVMKTTIESLYQTEKFEEYDGIANQFSRIAQAEKDKWLPYYYTSLTYVFKSFKIEDLDQRDQILDQALVELKLASKIESQNSEIVALEGFIYMIKISIDPGTRGQTLSPKAIGLFSTAIEIDGQNPRALLFMGQMHYGMSQFFGSGTAEACTTIEKSVQLFENAKTDDISPSWGKESAIEAMKQCGETSKG